MYYADTSNNNSIIPRLLSLYIEASALPPCCEWVLYQYVSLYTGFREIFMQVSSALQSENSAGTIP